MCGDSMATRTVVAALRESLADSSERIRLLVNNRTDLQVRCGELLEKVESLENELEEAWQQVKHLRDDNEILYEQMEVMQAKIRQQARYIDLIVEG